MITEKDLQEAIAECNGVRNPNANTCLKLAAYYTIKDHLYDDNDTSGSEIPSYSYAAEPVQPIQSVTYNGNSEFAQIIKEQNIDHIIEVIDELMDTIKIINPRLYDGVIIKLSS